MMRIYVSLIFGALLSASSVAPADTVWLAKADKPYENVIIFDASQGTLEFRDADNKVISQSIIELAIIRVSGDNDYNQAEQLLVDKQYDRAALAFALIANGTKIEWKQQLATFRRMKALELGGNIDKALATWLEIVEESPSDDNTRGVLSMRPRIYPSKGSPAIGEAIIVLLKAKRRQTDFAAYSSELDKAIVELQQLQGILPASAPTTIPISRWPASAPTTTLLKVPGDAFHIVYVCDRSGSMLDTLDKAKAAISESLDTLGPAQTFEIIFFSGGKPVEDKPRGLVYANEASKREALRSLEIVTAEGQTDPMPALRRAFDVLAQAPNKNRGKLIYLLTDGDFPDNDEVLRQIRVLNKNKTVCINTILYRNSDHISSTELEAIAKENGGVFKSVEDRP